MWSYALMRIPPTQSEGTRILLRKTMIAFTGGQSAQRKVEAWRLAVPLPSVKDEESAMDELVKSMNLRIKNMKAQQAQDAKAQGQRA